MLYNKTQFSKVEDKWVKTGVATLTEQEAEDLNSCSKYTGVKYEKAEEEDAFEIDKAKKDELIAYAEKNGIDLKDASSKEEIKEIIKNS